MLYCGVMKGISDRNGLGQMAGIQNETVFNARR